MAKSAPATDLLRGANSLARLRGAQLVRRVGRVVRITGLIIESEGPNVAVGDVCSIIAEPGAAPIHAEVVGFREQRILLMPLGEMQHLRPGSEVVASSFGAQVPVGRGLLGRTIDGLGRPIDGRGDRKSVV